MLTEDICSGLNVALNESRLLSVQFDRLALSATVWCEVLTLPEDGPESADAVVALRVGGVTRVAASLREGWRNDKNAAVTPITLDHLDAVARDFGGSATYGWERAESAERSLLRAANKSLDWFTLIPNVIRSNTWCAPWKKDTFLSDIVELPCWPYAGTRSERAPPLEIARITGTPASAHSAACGAWVFSRAFEPRHNVEAETASHNEPVLVVDPDSSPGPG